MKLINSTFYLFLGVLMMVKIGHTETQLNWQDTTYGKLTFTTMVNAPYPHESRKDGRTVGDTVYSFEQSYNNNTVVIIVPKKFKPGTELDIVFHLHGHYQDLDRILGWYQLGEQLNNSKRNAILVIPQGPVKVPDSQFGKLDEKDGFKRFMDELFGKIQNDPVINPSKKKLKLHDITLMGHSGGYYTIGQILDQGGLIPHIKEVYLLDATYGQLEKYTAWEKKYKGRLISIFTEHLAMQNTLFMALLDKNKIPYKVVAESQLTTNDLKQNRVLFLPTELDHDKVPFETKLVERFLKTY